MNLDNLYPTHFIFERVLPPQDHAVINVYIQEGTERVPIGTLTLSNKAYEDFSAVINVGCEPGYDNIPTCEFTEQDNRDAPNTINI